MDTFCLKHFSSGFTSRCSSPFSHSFFLYNLDSISILTRPTSLAIAYLVFQELSTAYRDNRPILEFYTIMRDHWHQPSMEEELCSTYSACGCAKKQQKARDPQRLFQFLYLAYRERIGNRIDL